MTNQKPFNQVMHLVRTCVTWHSTRTADALLIGENLFTVCTPSRPAILSYSVLLFVLHHFLSGAWQMGEITAMRQRVFSTAFRNICRAAQQHTKLPLQVCVSAGYAGNEPIEWEAGNVGCNPSSGCSAGGLLEDWRALFSCWLGRRGPVMVCKLTSGSNAILTTLCIGWFRIRTDTAVTLMVRPLNLNLNPYASFGALYELRVTLLDSVSARRRPRIPAEGSPRGVQGAEWVLVREGCSKGLHTERLRGDTTHTTARVLVPPSTACTVLQIESALITFQTVAEVVLPNWIAPIYFPVYFWN